RTISARAQRLNWDELSRLDGTAVLFIEGNHYVAVDPRNTPRDMNQAAAIRIYEPQKPAQWWTQDKLEAAWEGEALVLIKQTPRVKETASGPCIVWDQCFVDQGILMDTPLAHYQFAFRNVGSSDLIIGDVKSSCGC